jgi:hypothetical protein
MDRDHRWPAAASWRSQRHQAAAFAIALIGCEPLGVLGPQRSHVMAAAGRLLPAPLMAQPPGEHGRRLIVA